MPSDPPKAPLDPRYPEAERIANSLRDFPEDWGWHHKGYELKHFPTGFVLWVANQDYGLKEVWANGGKSEFSKPEQAIIWPAVEGWLARSKVGFSGRPAKPRITRFEGCYFCESAQLPWRGFGHTPENAYWSWLAAISVQARKRLPKDLVLTVWSAKP
ncbi:hypothetical protein HAQ06_08540 [Pseudomonas sp. C2L12B]|uniref:Uncharacterized protein n=2 Tax=Pseudomonas typographi TaxID=2715964 RepID=A0ABR7YZG5_9PSED|nr:hypothetical protein [Pseudomonas typographi]MBD1598603.1 hypothetical protein [Pseudomonas typographi]